MISRGVCEHTGNQVSLKSSYSLHPVPIVIPWDNQMNRFNLESDGD